MQAAQFRCEAAIVGGCEAKLKLLFTSQLGVKGLRADESDTEHDSETGTGCRNDSAVREREQHRSKQCSKAHTGDGGT